MPFLTWKLPEYQRFITARSISAQTKKLSTPTLLGVSSEELDEHVASRLHLPERPGGLRLYSATRTRRITCTASWLQQAIIGDPRVIMHYIRSAACYSICFLSL
jgi:hypothetical protein